jgi:hypothetical protein
MKILYSPQLNEIDILNYHFESEKITATLNGQSDIFDFSQMPNGKAMGGYQEAPITTNLGINPIVEAIRENGILKVTLVNFIGMDASEEDKFPNWKDV